ncbi:MAG TPA: leucyl aminopeptidase [Candidatus Binatia bacterium]|nr:leucyl aminopeptidase [Candidatus Binatia bacterium]
MKYTVKSAPVARQQADCAIVGVFDRRALDAHGEALDKTSRGALGQALKRGDLDGKSGQTLLLSDVPHVACERVLLVGLGRERDFDEAAYRKACAAAARALRATGAADAVSYLTHLTVKARDAAWRVQQAVLATEDELYRFDEFRGSKARADIALPKLRTLTLDVPEPDLKAGERAAKGAQAVAAGVRLTKDLGNTPPNVCTPTYLAGQAQQLAQRHPDVSVRVLDREELERLGMGSFLGVARGSRQPPKLILLEYRKGADGAKPVALVGKGITFDSGGISIKPADKMDEMKFDMCGGASVIGAFEAVARLGLPINLVGAVPACENLPDGEANKPGDIVSSMAGITIEILNTDAEGRLILCDALTYVEKEYEPAVCIDIATLTGACVIALGAFASGLFSNTPELAQALLAAGEATGDRAWQLPLWEDYQGMLKSEHADVANVSGGRDAGAITAASFLHRFTRKMKWAHLDVAGTAWRGKRATGRPVPLLVEYLSRYAERAAKPS